VYVGCVCGASARRVSICTFCASICTFVPVKQVDRVPVCAALPRDAHSAFSRVCRTVASLASALSANSMRKAAASLATWTKACHTHHYLKQYGRWARTRCGRPPLLSPPELKHVSVSHALLRCNRFSYMHYFEVVGLVSGITCIASLCIVYVYNIYVYVCVCVCVCVCACVRVCVYTHIYMCVCIYICTYVYVHTYIYIYNIYINI
jgi:hypothetical protein